MTQPLSWNLHGNDQLSSVLERLDRTLSKLGRRFDDVSMDARGMGRAIGDVEPPVRRAATAADHASGRFLALGERMASLATRAAQMAAAIAAAATVGIAAVGSIAVRTASANEQAAISFELLLGSAQKAALFLQDIQKFAAATPFEMPELRTAASRLLAVGVAAKDIIPLLTTLGDATSGMGTGAEGIQRAITALTQMRMKTKVSAEEMLQLTEAGIPAWEALAAVLKTDVQSAMKLVEKRQVDATKVFEAIQTKAGTAMSRLSGMMARQSTTLEGVWSTFKDNASQALAKFAEPAIPALKKFVDASGEAVPAVLDKLRGMAGDVREAFKGSDVPERLMASLKTLGSRILPMLEESWGKIMGTVRDNREGLEKLGRFIADFVVPVLGTMLLSSIDMVTMAFQATIFVLSKVVDGIRIMVGTTLSMLKLLVDGAAAAFGWIPGLGPKLKEAAAAFDKWAQGLWDKLNALDGKTVTFKVQAKLSGSAAAAANERSGGTYVSGRAVGGPMWAGESYDVGEKGVERFYAATTGTMQSNESLRSAMARGGGADEIVLRVVHETPEGRVIREELLRFKRNRGLPTLGLA